METNYLILKKNELKREKKNKVQNKWKRGGKKIKEEKLLIHIYMYNLVGCKKLT